MITVHDTVLEPVTTGEGCGFCKVRNFLSWPLSFTGLEGAPQIFKKIPEKNQSALTIVVEKAETLSADSRCFTLYFEGRFCSKSHGVPPLR